MGGSNISNGYVASNFWRVAMLTNLGAAALGGSSIPRLLHRFRIDPAVSSDAFVKTVADVAGYGLFLEGSRPCGSSSSTVSSRDLFQGS